MVLMAQQLPLEARFCFIQAERYDPKEVRWPYLLAITLIREDAAAATVCLERAANLAEDDPVVRLQLGETLLEPRRLAGAEAQFRRVLESDPTEPRALLGLGRVAYFRGELRVSLGYLTRATGRAKGARMTHALLAEIHCRLKEKRAAETELRLAAELPEADWPDRYLDEVDRLKVGLEPRIGVAEKLVQQRRLAEAGNLLRDLAADHPRAAAVQTALGRLYLLKLDLPGATEAFRKADALRPEHFPTYCNLATALQGLRRYAEAAAWYQKALRLKPRDGLAYYHLAQCLHLQGNRAGAIQTLRQAVRFKPELAAAHRDLGELLSQAGQPAEAVVELRYAVHLAPGDAAARSLLAALQETAFSKKR
jgi:tetratricopeptide (TPR) repeat protein